MRVLPDTEVWLVGGGVKIIGTVFNDTRFRHVWLCKCIEAECMISRGGDEKERCLRSFCMIIKDFPYLQLLPERCAHRVSGSLPRERA